MHKSSKSLHIGQRNQLHISVIENFVNQWMHTKEQKKSAKIDKI